MAVITESVASPIDLTQEAGALADWEDVRRDLAAAVESALWRDGFTAAVTQNEAVAARIEGVLGRDLANAVWSCFRSGEADVRRDGSVRWRPYHSCHQPRLCVFHARLEGKRRIDGDARAGGLRDAVARTLHWTRLQLVTFTVPNVDAGALADTVAALWAAWGRLRRRRVWDKPVAAAAAQLEITRNAETGQWHPHLHVLAAVRYGVDFSWRAVMDTWRAVAGGLVVHFDRVEVRGAAGVMAALAKFGGYLSKIPDLVAWPDAALAEWWATVRGSRHWRTYGAWYDRPAQDPGDPVEVVARFRWTWNGPRRALAVWFIQDDNSTDWAAVRRAVETWVMQRRAAVTRRKRRMRRG